MVRSPLSLSQSFSSPIQGRAAGTPPKNANPLAVGGRGPTPAFARALSLALLARQDRSQTISTRRQEFPLAGALGGVADASLSRLINRTALSRMGARPHNGSPAAKRSGRGSTADVEKYYKGATSSRPHPATFDGFIRESAQRHQVPEELIKAVIKVESNFNPRATSPKGAMGLMQLMPGTARDLGVRQGYDPRENIDGGTRYLRGLLDRYQGNVPKALAAYNWGPGNLERGGSLPQETRSYLQLISQYCNIRHVPAKNAAKPAAPPAPPAPAASTRT